MLRAAPSQVEAATRMPFRSMASAPASRSSWIRSSSISHETAPSWSSIEIATPGPSTGTSPDRTWRSSRVLRASWMAASSLLAEPRYRARRTRSAASCWASRSASSFRSARIRVRSSGRSPASRESGRSSLPAAWTATRKPTASAPTAMAARLWILAGGRIDGLRPPSQCSPRTGSSPPPSSLTEEVPPDRRQALEHPHAEHDDHPDRKVLGAQTVAEPHHEHRQQGVRQERHQQLALVVHALQAVADPLEHHVERSHHDHREVGGQADRELRPQDQPEDDTGDQRQQGDHGATSAAGRAQDRPVAASRLGMRRASSARTEKPRPYSSVHTASCSAIEDRSSPRRSCSGSPIAAIRYGDDSGRKLTWTRPPASRIAVMAATRRPFTATARLPADHRALTTSWMSTSWIRRSRTSPRVRGASSLSRSSTTSPGPSIGPSPAGGRSCSTRSKTPASSADPSALAACAEARRSPSFATSPESDRREGQPRPPPPGHALLPELLDQGGELGGHRARALGVAGLGPYPNHRLLRMGDDQGPVCPPERLHPVDRHGLVAVQALDESTHHGPLRLPRRGHVDTDHVARRKGVDNVLEPLSGPSEQLQELHQAHHRVVRREKLGEHVAATLSACEHHAGFQRRRRQRRRRHTGPHDLAAAFFEELPHDARGRHGHGHPRSVDSPAHEIDVGQQGPVNGDRTAPAVDQPEPLPRRVEHHTEVGAARASQGRQLL